MYPRFFLKYFWRALYPTNDDIGGYMRAQYFENGQKCYSDLENPNIGMITSEPTSQILSIESSYSIPFLQKNI